jgi:hypothetical protein
MYIPTYILITHHRIEVSDHEKQKRWVSTTAIAITHLPMFIYYPLLYPSPFSHHTEDPCGQMKDGCFPLACVRLGSSPCTLLESKRNAGSCFRVLSAGGLEPGAWSLEPGAKAALSKCLCPHDHKLPTAVLHCRGEKSNYLLSTIYNRR